MGRAAAWGWWDMIGNRFLSQPFDVATEARPEYERRATDAQGYVWQQGASNVAECLATGKEPLFTPEHALHVVEIMTAARESQRDGRRISLTSTFKWPVVPT